MPTIKSEPTSDSRKPTRQSFEAQLIENVFDALSGVPVPVALPEPAVSRKPQARGDQASSRQTRRKIREGVVVYGTYTGDKFVVHPSKGPPKAGSGKAQGGVRAAIARAVKGTLEESGRSELSPAALKIARVVERALPEARRQASEATIERMVGALLESQDPIAPIRVEIDAANARARMRFMNNFATLTADEVADQAGSQARNRHQQASRWKAEGKIFSISWQGLERFPAFQFKEGRPLPAVAGVLAALPRRLSRWETAFWFVSTNGWLDGRAPRDLLAEPERVIAAAKREGEAVVG